LREIRVLVVDDHAILRDGIRSLLERQDDMKVIGEAANGQEALAQIGELQPDIVLMDVNMPGMNGLEATRHVKALYPQVKILILTQHDSQEYISPLLQAGASGYVLKRSGGREVVNAIRHVVEEGAFIEPSVAHQFLNHYAGAESSKEPGYASLTEREREILRLISFGKSNKEIARALVISPKTVSVHRTNIMTKLNVKNSFELIRYVTTNRPFKLEDDDGNT
jgi:DNA-binding NarL/FixJ family response regulator